MSRTRRTRRTRRVRQSALAVLLPLFALACGGEDGESAWEGDDERMAEDLRRSEREGEDTLPRPPDGLSPWEHARERGVDFRAIGQEPGWFVEIDEEGRTLVALDYGERRFTVTTPEPEHDPEGSLTTYRVAIPADRLIIEIRREPCQDIMSGEAFEAAVTLVVDGEEFRGCGRALR